MRAFVGEYRECEDETSQEGLVEQTLRRRPLRLTETPAARAKPPAAPEPEHPEPYFSAFGPDPSWPRHPDTKED